MISKVCLFTFVFILIVASSWILAFSAASVLPVELQKQNQRRIYCVANTMAPEDPVEVALEYVCTKGKRVDCNIIKLGGICYMPNNTWFHASVVLNSYYRSHASQEFFCVEQGPLKHIGLLTITDPSFGRCKFN